MWFSSSSRPMLHNFVALGGTLGAHFRILGHLAHQRAPPKVPPRWILGGCQHERVVPFGTHFGAILRFVGTYFIVFSWSVFLKFLAPFWLPKAPKMIDFQHARHTDLYGKYCMILLWACFFRSCLPRPPWGASWLHFGSHFGTILETLGRNFDDF